MASQCAFCLSPEQRIKQIQAFVPELEASRCVYKTTPNFMTTVDMHPILPETPYFLLIPTHHFTSFDQIDERHCWEIDSHLQFIKGCVAHDGGQRHLLMFEHGQHHDGNAVKSIYHAHLHVLWTDCDVRRIASEVLEELDFLGVDYHWATCCKPYLHSLHDTLPRQQDYMYLRIDDHELIALDDGDGRFYSQFFRLLFCRALHVRFADWKEMEPWKHELFAQRLLHDLPRRYFGSD